MGLFYTPDKMTIPLAIMEAAVAIANVLAAPLAALLLLLNGYLGVRGWQWLFLIEGCVTLLLGIAIRRFLPLNLQRAQFLSGSEKVWLSEQLQGHSEAVAGASHAVTPGSSTKSVVAASLAAATSLPTEKATLLSAPDVDGNGKDKDDFGGNSSSKPVAVFTNASDVLDALCNTRVLFISAVGLMKNAAVNGILFW